MSLALQRMDDDKRDFQECVSRSLLSSPNHSQSPNRTHAAALPQHSFETCNALFQALLDGTEGNLSRGLVDAWDTLALYSTRVHELVLRQQARGQVHLLRSSLELMRLAL
jgi:hypothetical protein